MYKQLLSPAVRTVCTRMNSLLPWLNTCYCVAATRVCTCHCILNCAYVLKRRNTIWLVNITCAWLARLFGTTPNAQGFKERKMNAQSVCVCVPVPEWNCVCSYFLYGHMCLHCSDMLSCPDLWLIMKTAGSSSWGGSPTSFFNSKDLFLSFFALFC